MYTTSVMFSDLENRFDVTYYNPTALHLLNKLKEKSKKKGFELRNLSKFGDLKKGIFFMPAKEYKDNGTPFIRVSSIKDLTIDVNEITFISDYWNDLNKKTIAEPKDIVISKGGSTVGYVGIVPDWIGKINISQDIIGFYVHNKKESGFLATYLRSRLGQIQMNKVKSQQAQAHLTLTPMRMLKVLYNEEIASKVSKLINKSIQYESEFLFLIKKAKEELLKYVDIKLDNKEIMTFSIKYSDLESKFFPTYYYPKYLTAIDSLRKKFKTIKLGKISKTINGIEIGSKNYQKDGIPFIRTTDFVNYTIERNSYHKINESIYVSNKQDIKKKDILFTNDGKIGFSAFVMDDEDFLFQSHIKRIRIINKDFTPEYIFIFLITDIALYQIYRRQFIQSTISTIENGLLDIDIPIIDKKLMEEITNYCKKAFDLKMKRNKLIDESLNLVESLVFNKNDLK